MFNELSSQLTLLHCLLMILSIPLMLQKVKRNRFYGFRLKKTLSSDEIWYPANVIAGRALFGAGVIGLGLVQASAAGLVELSDTILTVGSIGVIVIAVIYSMVRVKSM